MNTLNFSKIPRYTDGSIAQGWVKEGAWHGVYRSRLSDYYGRYDDDNFDKMNC